MSQPQRSMTPEQVKAARALLGLKQEDLADLAGLSRNNIAAYENGRGVSGVLYDKIFDALVDAGIEFLRGGVRVRG